MEEYRLGHNLSQEVIALRKTSWYVVVVGIIITVIGVAMVRGTFGAGVTGFGIATIVLGLLDMARAPAKT